MRRKRIRSDKGQKLEREVRFHPVGGRRAHGSRSTPGVVPPIKASACRNLRRWVADARSPSVVATSKSVYAGHHHVRSTK